MDRADVRRAAGGVHGQTPHTTDGDAETVGGRFQSILQVIATTHSERADAGTERWRIRGREGACIGESGSRGPAIAGGYPDRQCLPPTCAGEDTEQIGRANPAAGGARSGFCPVGGDISLNDSRRRVNGCRGA